MTVEPSKSQQLLCTRSLDPATPGILFGGVDIAQASTLKLSGILFDSKLSLRQHISSMTVRASQRLGLLRRAARILDTNGRLSVYQGFIRPMLEYAPLVWMSAAPIHLARLDRIQRKAMAIIGPDVLLQSLAARRTLSGLCYMYKLQCIESPQQLTNIVPPAAPTVVRPRTRHTHAVTHPHQPLNTLPPAAPEYIRRSFTFAHISLWNQLPPFLFQPSMSLQRLHRFKAAAWKHLLHTDWLWAIDHL